MEQSTDELLFEEANIQQYQRGKIHGEDEFCVKIDALIAKIQNHETRRRVKNGLIFSFSILYFTPRQSSYASFKEAIEHFSKSTRVDGYAMVMALTLLVTCLLYEMFWQIFINFL